MSLYNKYRPTNLTQIRGNSEVVATLEGMLEDKESFPHSFLLHGPTGCGKTTVARIIANELGCHPNDYMEIDSADYRGIDTIRELRRNSAFLPSSGKVRVWVSDEAHQNSGDAQSALLKLLEDPPPHAYFILCTTEPGKLLPAIRGRCINLEMSLLTDKQMNVLLKQITRAEGNSLDNEIYEQIIQDSLGHPRDAIQILEKVLSVDPDQRLKVAQQTAERHSQVIELCRILINGGSWNKCKEILKGLKGQNAESVRRAVLGYAQSVLLNGANDQAAAVIETFWEPTYDIGFPGVVYACYSVLK